MTQRCLFSNQLVLILITALAGCGPQGVERSNLNAGNDPGGNQTLSSPTPIPIKTGLSISIPGNSNCALSSTLSVFPYGSMHPQTPPTYQTSLSLGANVSVDLQPGAYEVWVRSADSCLRATSFFDVKQNEMPTVSLQCFNACYGSKQGRPSKLRSPASAAPSTSK
jgi:hypothetical protein